MWPIYNSTCADMRVPRPWTTFSLQCLPGPNNETKAKRKTRRDKELITKYPLKKPHALPCLSFTWMMEQINSLSFLWFAIAERS